MVDPQITPWLIGGAVFAVAVLIILAFGDDTSNKIERRLTRVGPVGNIRKIDTKDRAPTSFRHARDSSIPLLDRLIGILPNPDKLRQRLARTGLPINLSEYLLGNLLLIVLFFLLFSIVLQWTKLIAVLVALALGLLIPHMISGFVGNRRIKKFLASFPEAIDTMCRGLRSGLPVTESIAAVGREIPAPLGLEFSRISDGVTMGKSLEASMWEVTRRIDIPEFRFLIIAMTIQKETGGNLAETLGNLADLIRRRRQLRLKVKAMSSEAKMTALILSAIPFLMFGLMMAINSEHMMIMFKTTPGKLMLGGGLFWMSLGWTAMTKMINFEI